MKIGTVGTGKIVEEFLDAVLYVKEVKCSAVYSRKEETARRIADKYNVEQIYTDYDSLVRDKNIDFIYIAVPNSLHFEYALKALNNGKNVICEKPFTPTVKEAQELIDLAKQKGLLIFEAITTIHLPNFIEIKKQINRIGDIKLVQCNFSQYSSKYDRFLEGEISNVFNPEFSGGALADINIYNFHFVAGLFGKANEVYYAANIAENGIDTSGIAILKYDNFICECTGAKDSSSPSFVIIQGTKGYIKLNGPANECPSLEIGIGDKVSVYNMQEYSNRMVNELIAFNDIYKSRDYNRCYSLLEHSLNVIEMAVKARKGAGIIFSSDL